MRCRSPSDAKTRDPIEGGADVLTIDIGASRQRSPGPIWGWSRDWEWNLGAWGRTHCPSSGRPAKGYRREVSGTRAGMGGASETFGSEQDPGAVRKPSRAGIRGLDWSLPGGVAIPTRWVPSPRDESGFAVFIATSPAKWMDRGSARCHWPARTPDPVLFSGSSPPFWGTERFPTPGRPETFPPHSLHPPWFPHRFAFLDTSHKTRAKNQPRAHINPHPGGPHPPPFSLLCIHPRGFPVRARRTASPIINPSIACITKP